MGSKVLAAAVAVALGINALFAASPAAAQGSDAAEIAELKAQLAQLQARVAELEQRSDAQSAINASTQQNVEAMQQKPETPPADAWASDTKIGGTMFTDFTSIDQTSNGRKTDLSGTGLDVKRFYLSVDHKFTGIWSANLTTDFNYSSSDGETQLFVKKAYLQGTFAPLAILRVGSAGLPWTSLAEDFYGYRFVEDTIVPRAKFGQTADWGLHMLGDNGVFNYAASVVNGAGYKNPSRSNSVDFEGRVGVQPVKGLMFAVGGYSGDLGKDTQSTPAQHTAHRYDALAAYNANGLRLGAEWFRADNWNNVNTPVTDSADGWSLWASYDFAAPSVFARYDRVNPSKDIDPSLKDTYYNLGVAFLVTKGVRVAVAYKNERLKNDSSTDVRTREFGAWGEVKW